MIRRALYDGSAFLFGAPLGVVIGLASVVIEKLRA